MLACIQHARKIPHQTLIHSPDLCLVYESKWSSRRSKIWMYSPDRRSAAPELLFDRSYEDVYSDPGSPLSRRTKNGTYVLAKVGRLMVFVRCQIYTIYLLHHHAPKPPIPLPPGSYPLQKMNHC